MKNISEIKMKVFCLLLTAILSNASVFADIQKNEYYSTPGNNTNQSRTVSWWNENYQYRRQLTISNNSSELIEPGYTAKYNLDHSALVSTGKSRSDGNDVRIVFWDGSSNDQLERVNENGWNSPSSDIWFKVQDNIPGNTNSEDYYIYYGNPSVGAPPADREDVYLFWDGFDSGTLKNEWTWVDPNGDCSYTIGGGEINLWCPNNSTNHDLYSPTSNRAPRIMYDIGTNNFVYTTKVRVYPFHTVHGGGITVFLDYNHFYRYTRYYQSTQRIGLSKREGGSWIEPVGSFISTSDNELWLRIIKNGSNFSFLYSYDSITWHTYILNHSFPSLDQTITVGDMLMENQAWSEFDSYFDDVKIRLYVSPEPSVSGGLEVQDIYSPENVIISIGSGNVNLSWDAVPGAISYKIYSDTDPYGAFSTIEWTGSDTSWSEAVSEDKKFYYVTAVN